MSKWQVGKAGVSRLRKTSRSGRRGRCRSRLLRLLVYCVVSGLSFVNMLLISKVAVSLGPPGTRHVSKRRDPLQTGSKRPSRHQQTRQPIQCQFSGLLVVQCQFSGLLVVHVGSPMIYTEIKKTIPGLSTRHVSSGGIVIIIITIITIIIISSSSSIISVVYIYIYIERERERYIYIYTYIYICIMCIHIYIYTHHYRIYLSGTLSTPTIHRKNISPPTQCLDNRWN